MAEEDNGSCSFLQREVNIASRQRFHQLMGMAYFFRRPQRGQILQQFDCYITETLMGDEILELPIISITHDTDVREDLGEEVPKPKDITLGMSPCRNPISI